MSTNGSELCFGLMLLLEAAEYQTANLVTPSCHRKRDVTTTSSSSLAPLPLCPVQPIYSKSVSFSSPPNKRFKLNFGDVSCGSPLGHSNPRFHTDGNKYSLIKKSSKCSSGSAHRVWEQTNDECAVTATSARRFDTSNTIEAIDEQQDDDDKTFVLYDKGDDKHINAVHNIIRRDIWEGFVVDTSRASTTEDFNESPSNARRSGRLARYDGTIGFRCRFCKNAPLIQRAERSAVYPRTLERIYLANIRFQRDHIEHCTFIPNQIKEKYSSLKNSNGVARGRKQYWVSSAIRRGLCDGKKGIIFSSETK